MAPKAVLFDLDGTLVDSLDDITLVLGRVLARHGRPMPDRSAVARMVGDGARNLVARAVGLPVADPTVAGLTDDYIAAYADDPTPATKLIPGAMALLDELVARDIPAVVVTNKPGPIARDVVQRMFGPRIRATIGAGDTKERKPNPAPILAGLAAVSVAPADAWMVGDGAQDVEAARAAGVFAVAFTGGYGKPQSADLVVDDLGALRARLD